jgi:predicted AlkP superfamily phosphohydrolase/phosphomutase
MKKEGGRCGLCFLFVLSLLIAGCSRAPKQKVFVLGIDGLTFDLLVPWAQEGKLPHFAQLLEEGSSTQLVSTIPPISPAAWTSAVTGTNPGKHGIFGFVKEMRANQDGSPNPSYYTALDRQVDPLWTILSERGRRSVVVNVPCSSPPDRLKGVMISGFPYTSQTHFTYPPEYRFKISNYRKDHYRMVSKAGEEAFLKDMNEIMSQRAKVVANLLEEEPWDLFFVVFTITDRVQHHFWKFMDPQHPDWEAHKAELYGDAILKAYQRMDEFLGQLLPKLDAQTSLLVMSDHGFGPVYQPVNAQNFIDQNVSSDELQVISNDTFGASFYIASPKNMAVTQKTHQAYFRTRELLKRELEGLRDPATGNRIIQKVYQKEDLYWGPQASKAPDILGLENRGYLFWNWHPTEDKRIFPRRDHPIFERIFSGYHVMNGVLMMTGANVQQGAMNFEAQLMDIAPTVLYLLGEPVPQEMDGKILEAPITPNYLASHALDARRARPHKPHRMQGLTDSTEAINEYIEEQLRAIGYVQ